ncbi:MAG: hypothetical protein JKX72_05135 [Robiginitomaculum sp.]|nr:hypothetical protein [Robiginitomaculum sp.]
MAAQLPLDLTIAPDYSDAAFIQGACNSEAYSAVNNVSMWANNTLSLIGPHGCGKTHLGHIWARQHDTVCLDGNENFTPKSSWRGKAIWIDNAQSADEFTLFTLINLAITSDVEALLLCDRNPPNQWNVDIPDLRSRLKNIQIAHLDEPDEDVLSSVLHKLFKDRGLKVSEALISYLLANTDRSVNALRSLVRDLDKAAAQKKANVTRSFASKFLQGTLF